MKKRIGHKMEMVADFVRRHPGGPKILAARHVAPGRTVGLAYGYAAVNRAIRAGLVRAVKGPRNSWLLFPGVSDEPPRLDHAAATAGFGHPGR